MISQRVRTGLERLCGETWAMELVYDETDVRAKNFYIKLQRCVMKKIKYYKKKDHPNTYHGQQLTKAEKSSYALKKH